MPAGTRDRRQGRIISFTPQSIYSDTHNVYGLVLDSRGCMSNQRKLRAEEMGREKRCPPATLNSVLRGSGSTPESKNVLYDRIILISIPIIFERGTGSVDRIVLITNGGKQDKQICSDGEGPGRSEMRRTSEGEKIWLSQREVDLDSN
ncbi:hypothetical protein RRG08_022277 [Elysia crispata]|uniref:Uncharacterized protein n=1 Tax=Elysia crispata TaxID=231223 RepID=A0AAE1DK97_9GAST|nr:hypothetical protein RRG08_022277 [Elysia crispata]